MREDRSLTVATLEHTVPRVFSLDDRAYMQEALDLAERGRREAHPNPRVGALVVADGDVVGRGWHRGPGTPHAEIMALDEAGVRAHGATLYSTLEPCCTQGCTPPCTEAVAASGVARVVVGVRDPNPAVDGRGLAALRDAGIDVVTVEGQTDLRAARLIEPFGRYMRDGLPAITYKVAVSLDGKVAGGSGQARWLSGEESRRLVHAWRAAADAVLVGAGTVRRDDPSLTVRAVEGPDPVRVVASRDGDLPLGCRLVTTAATTPTILLTERIDGTAEAALRERGVEVVVTGTAGLSAGLATLAQRGLLDILMEGGPTLAGNLLSEGLVQRLAVFVTPLLIGRGAPDAVATAAVDVIDDALRLDDVQWRVVGRDALVEGRLVQSAACRPREEGR